MCQYLGIVLGWGPNPVQPKKEGHQEKETGQHLDCGLPAGKNYEKINFHYIRHLVCGILLWQCRQTTNIKEFPIQRDPKNISCRD